MRAVLVALLALIASACGDNRGVAPVDDAAVVSIDAAPSIDAGVDAAVPVLGPCLDRPTELLRPPSGALPCELMPPGLTLGGSP